MTTVAQFNARYEQVIHSDATIWDHDQRLSALMTELQRHFRIPVLQDASWEACNRSVIALYRKIAFSRMTV